MKTVLGIFLAVLSCGQIAGADIFEMNQRIGAGINMGNALDAPSEGLWGVTLKEEYFKAVRDAGFDSIRLPVKWSAHAGSEPPYTIDPKFLARVDWAVEQALQNGLKIVLNIHHYSELMDDPDGHADRFVGLWAQIAPHYKDKPDTVYFELLNEPCNKMNAEKWNSLASRALSEVRKSNPVRPVIIGPVNWNNYKALPELQIPEQDRNIIVTFHYYDPFEFTHQGTTFTTPSLKDKTGIVWPANQQQPKEIMKVFLEVRKWAREHNRPVYVGEFGTYQEADMESRTRWANAVVKSCRMQDFSYAYWQFASAFGIYDTPKKQWTEPVLKPVIGNSDTLKKSDSNKVQ